MTLNSKIQMKSADDFIRKILKETGIETPQAQMLNKELENSFTKIKTCIMMFVLSYFLSVLYPIYALVFEDKLVPAAKMEIPYVDQTQIGGYIVGACVITFVASMACVGGAAYDTILAFFVFNYAALIQLLEEDLKQYHKMWQKRKENSYQDRNYFLKNFCVKYQDVHG